jgi:hypothetical protein
MSSIAAPDPQYEDDGLRLYRVKDAMRLLSLNPPGQFG